MKTINISLASEGYTHKNWFYKNIFINFSMIYYIIDGTAYYSDENGTILLKKNHLYIFPARKMFTLYDDPQNQLYHTFIHAITLPSVNSLVEVNVQDDSFLRDTIALLRKYLNSFNKQFVSNILDLILAYVFADIPCAARHSPGRAYRTRSRLGSGSLQNCYIRCIVSNRRSWSGHYVGPAM